MNCKFYFNISLCYEIFIIYFCSPYSCNTFHSYMKILQKWIYQVATDSEEITLT